MQEKVTRQPSVKPLTEVARQEADRHQTHLASRRATSNTLGFDSGKGKDSSPKHARTKLVGVAVGEHLAFLARTLKKLLAKFNLLVNRNFVRFVDFRHLRCIVDEMADLMR